jgi:NAD(P)H-flavin reductase
MQDRNTLVKVPLIARENLSHDTVRFRFGLPTSSTVLGLPVGACVKFYCPNVTGTEAGKWNGRDDAEKEETVVERKYTPCSSDRQKGSFDMVIKVYSGGVLPQFADGGKMSQHMGRLKVGDMMEMSGPWGQIEYTKPGEFTYLKKVTRR